MLNYWYLKKLDAYFNGKIFWKWCLLALIHSGIILYICLYFVGENFTDKRGTTNGIFTINFII